MPSCASSGSPRRACRWPSRHAQLGPNGADRVRLLFAPNPGEEARPLAKIALWGELSRVMLAVKQTLARTDEVLTYVFDEVDAGVGGGTAEIIGRKLKRLAAERQVIVITQLPQVAAFADAHVRVTKTAARGKTRVRWALRRRRWPGRDCGMLAGAAPSAQATAHAEEMLRNAPLIEAPRKRPLRSITNQPCRGLKIDWAGVACYLKGPGREYPPAPATPEVEWHADDADGNPVK